MNRSRISLDAYQALCEQADYGPNYHPRFVEYYFSRLRKRPRLMGIFDQGRLVAAFPTLFGQVFPTSAHKRLLGKKYSHMGEIGQPETLFPVLKECPRVALNRLSLTTSGLLAARVRGCERSLRAVAIARERRHRKLTIRQRDFFAGGGQAFFADQLSPKEFAEIYLRLHSSRWGYPLEGLVGVRDQILALYEQVFGVVLMDAGEPVAAQLCYRSEGPTLSCVDFVNSGVKLQQDNRISHGSIMMLTCLRRAEQDANTAGRRLRFSFGYYYGDQTYKAVWTEPEPTFIGY